MNTPPGKAPYVLLTAAGTIIIMQLYYNIEGLNIIHYGLILLLFIFVVGLSVMGHIQDKEDKKQ